MGGILPQKRSLVAFAPAQSFYVRERSQRLSDLNRSCVEQIEESLCFCGRMPPERGPLWRGEGAKEKPETIAAAGLAAIRRGTEEVDTDLMAIEVRAQTIREPEALARRFAKQLGATEIKTGR